MDSTSGRIGVLLGSTVDPTWLGVDLALEEVTVERPDGTSAQVTVYRFDDSCVLVPRHGPGHSVAAHLVDHHANLRALESLDCFSVVGVCSTGSLKPDLPVGSVVLPDDVFAPGIHPTFPGVNAGHRVPTIDAVLRAMLLEAWVTTQPGEAAPIDGGVYAQATGPRFETPSEVRFLAANADLVGMTMASEFFLAVELGIRYAAICSVDNLANGLGGVALDPAILADHGKANARRIARTLGAVLPMLSRALR